MELLSSNIYLAKSIISKSLDFEIPFKVLLRAGGMNGKTTNGGLGNTLDVIPKNLTMTFGASFAKTFSSFASSRHD